MNKNSCPSELFYSKNSWTVKCLATHWWVESQFLVCCENFQNVKLHFVTSHMLYKLESARALSRFPTRVKLNFPTMVGVKIKFRNKLQLSNSLCLKMTTHINVGKVVVNRNKKQLNSPHHRYIFIKWIYKIIFNKKLKIERSKVV